MSQTQEQSRKRARVTLETYLESSPVVAILGPRQSGKTTLARQLKADHYFDLENPRDLARLENPQTVLESLAGLVVIDEIQLRPDLFPLLRYLVDREGGANFLILGSASRELLRQGNQSLAGRIVSLRLGGFALDEVGAENWRSLWFRGGFPRAYLASDDSFAMTWLENYVASFLERDIPQFGIEVPAATLRRFWVMLSHYHGNVINYSELGRSLQVADTTVRHYLDVLESTFMVRVLRPWFTNTSKRLVKSPKIYLTDPGIFHRFQSITTPESLTNHPKLGASWEGYALNQLIQLSGLGEDEFYFWATHSGAELDLFWQYEGKNYGAEFKFSDAPRSTKSMQVAIADLELEHLWVIYPGSEGYALTAKMTVVPIESIQQIFQAQLATRSLSATKKRPLL